MKSLRALLLVIVIMMTSGCYYSGITGTVVDNATGKPIEGALVVAQWTKKHGFGLTYHTLSKITETVTDKNGAFALSGIKDSFVEPPEMIIYKEGYIPWRNDSIFPSSNIVKDHEWNNHVTYKLDVFSKKYAYEHFYSFLHDGIIGYGSEVPMYQHLINTMSKQKYDEIINYNK